MSFVTTHVLDTATGQPAHGVAVLLERHVEGAWVTLGGGTTSDDGRIPDLVAQGTTPEAGTHRLTFQVGAYHAAQQVEGFFPEVQVTFEIRDTGRHYHVPLLLSPFSYSTYRGS